VTVTSVNAAATAAELLDRMSVILKDRTLDDDAKEEQGLALLRHPDINVRRAVASALPDRLSALHPSAAFARLTNIQGELLGAEPALLPTATADMLIERVVRRVVEQHHDAHRETEALAQFISVPGEVVRLIQERLPRRLAKLQGSAQAWKVPVLERVLERLQELDGHLRAAESLAGDPETVASALLDALFYEIGLIGHRQDAAYSRIILTLTTQPPEVRRCLIRHLLARMKAGREGDHYVFEYVLKNVLGAVIEAERPLADDLSSEVFAWAGGFSSMQIEHQAFFPQLLALIEERLAQARSIPGTLVATLRRTDIAYSRWAGSVLKPLLQRLPDPVLNPGEAWSDAVLTHLEAPESVPAWTPVIQHALTATNAKPSASWLKKAAPLVQALGEEAFGAQVLSWLSLVGSVPTLSRERATFQSYDPNATFDEYNASALRGLVWMLGALPPRDEYARALSRLVETALRKVPGLGPRSPKIANAGVYALGQQDTLFAVAQLARLKTRVTFKTTLGEIEKALTAAAGRAGLSREDLEELSVPSFGLEAGGVRTERFDDVTVTLRVRGADVTLTWMDGRGKTVKSVPAKVKAGFAGELKELKTAVKDVAAALGAQAHRIEALVLREKRWPLAVWRERYLDHPLVGTLASRLIWTFTHGDWTGSGVWDGAQFVDAQGQGFAVPPEAEVTLWHPIPAGREEVVTWRSWLEGRGITQPFKQAWREVYLLTDAERRTRVYSNRFAAHILRQHQFNQLCALRGWRNQLRLMVDSSYPPATLELPLWNLRAEYWVEGIGDNYGADTTESGTYLRLVTDQVRFYRTDAPENHAHASGGGYEMWVPAGEVPAQPVPLEEVPPLVLSEVLRDVDLFVGVASVGNDPTWQDGGPEGRYREYWQSYSFGDLSATAQTRKEVLSRLLPRLKIGPRCTLSEKFLVVRGDRRTYKIHLGSSNILMEPNDQYLCIVPSRADVGSPGDVRLPFEGDGVLAVILSKAFLLADDTRITDSTILSQIAGR